MTVSSEDVVDKSVTAPEKALSVEKPAALAWRATWLDARAFQAVNLDSEPLKRGFYALLVAVVVAAVARLIGVGLGILTSPNITVIQDQIYSALTGAAAFKSLVEQTPEFAAQFDSGYFALWDILRWAGGYPSYAGLGSSLTGLLFTLASWLVFTSLTYLIAYWFGARPDFKRSLGVFALAYAPIMLTVVEAIPGATVAWSLIFLLILVAKFLAAREVYGLEPAGSLAVIMLPYLLGMILILSLLIFGAAIGLNQIPYLDEILRTIRFYELVAG